MTRSPRYASGTQVPVSRSKDELESLIRKHGGDQFGYIDDGKHVRIRFRLTMRYYQFSIRKPQLEDPDVDYYENRRAARERERWRQLILIVKAKFESIAMGIEQPEEAFMPQLVLPDGSTMGEWVKDEIEHIYRTGEMPALLDAGPRIRALEAGHAR